jgi:5'(3')-deoxyribonucleotidase
MHTHPIIAVDMDEVIADALGEHLSRYNRDFPEKLTVDDLQGRWLWDAVPPSRLPALERYMLSDDFFAVLDVMPHSQRVLERLQSRYDVFIATAAMEVPTSFTAKFQWLARHFPFIPTSRIVFCGDKSILRADYLIDDNPRQLRLFEGPITDASSRPERTPTDASSRPTGGSGETPVSAPTAASFRPEPLSEEKGRSGETPVFRDRRREGILFSSPANANVTGFRRVHDWLDVEKMFLG